MLTTIRDLILSVFLVSVSGTNLNLTAKPSSTVMVNGRVTLRCSVETGDERTLKTNWMHGGKMVGENCDSFSNLYNTSCPRSDRKNPPYYDFIIDHVRWQDRGNWSCYYGMNFSQIDLTVIVPPQMISHTIEKKKEVEGDGSRNRPYDLTPGHTISMSCKTSCGFPRSDLVWTFSNSTTNGNFGEPVTRFETGSCIDKSPKFQKGMYTRTSTFDSINCLKHKLIGFNEVTCSLNAKQPFKYDSGDNSKHVYILCPGGMKAPVLTYGEMIAIAVGAAIALIVIFLYCFLFKESRRKAMRNRALTISNH